MKAKRTIIRLMGLVLALALGLAAQGPGREAAPAAPAVAAMARTGPWSWSGSERLRVEDWNWFTPSSGDNHYAFGHSLLLLGGNYAGESVGINVEVAQDTLFGLPTAAVAPGTQGQLGLGATYEVANGGSSSASVFLKQANAIFRLGEHAAVRAGRFEFADGAELQPANATLRLLNSSRMGQRLIGGFGFSAVGRSFDGGEWWWGSGRSQLTAFAARPTEGVFQTQGMDELPITVVFGSYARTAAGGRGEFRVFVAGYDDGRQGDVKTDNRVLAARSGDRTPIRIGTYGADYAVVMSAGGVGQLDAMAWGALQSGRWGALRQRAGAFFAEAGFQPSDAPLRAWVSGGVSLGSGDGNPGDGVHGTFMQMLPTPRLAARFPFYNMENNQDFYGSAVLHAGPVAVRSEVHALRLSRAGDLWYQGGGAFQKNTFGFVGRPSGGARSLANVADLSLNFPLGRQLTVTAYYAHAWSKQVIRNIYPNANGADFAYLETNLRL